MLHRCFLTLLPFTFLLTAACAVDDNGKPILPGDCTMPLGGLIYPQAPPTQFPPDPDLTPTATATPDPDMPPGVPTITPTPTPTATPPPLPWCTPTPTPDAPAPIPSLTPSSGGSGIGAATDGTGVSSLSISPENQELLAVAVGPGKTAVAWQENGVIYLSTSKGESLAAAQPVALGEQASLAFSKTGRRLHMAYVRDGFIHYRAGSDINGLDQAPEERVTAGQQPYLVVDNEGFAHLFYIAGDTVYHRAQAAGAWLPTTVVGSGTGVSAVVTGSGYLLAAVAAHNGVDVYQRLGGQWLRRAQYIPESSLHGPPQIGTDGDWVYLAWVTEELDPVSDAWPRRRPEYKPAAPFVNRIHAGNNAQQYFTTYGVHTAGVYQQFATSPGTELTATAYFMAWSCDGCSGAGPEEPNPPSLHPANMQVQICLDPYGGVDASNPLLLCSAPNNTLDAWTPITVSAVASAATATLFLRSNPDLPRGNNDLYWDSVTVSGGTIVNGGFERAFPSWQGIGELKVAEGWIPFYIEDPPAGQRSGRYEVHLAWSGDEGISWSPEQMVAINAQDSNEKTGSIGPYAYPVVDAAGERVAVVFLYNEGDPTFSGGTIRYGRPSVVVCAVGTSTCWPDQSGARLLPASTNRPAVTLQVKAMNGTAVVAWDAYQGSLAQNKDVFATTFSPVSLRIGLGE
jgi:hypothetical protein